MRKPIRPPNEIELRNLQSLLSTGEPYEILGCELESSKKEIQKSYRDLARKYHPDKTRNSDGGDMMTKINNANAVLSDDRLREIYDVYLYENLKHGLEDGNEIDVQDRLERVKLIISFLILILSWPFSRVATIAQSTESNIGALAVVKRIYKQFGISGFYKGSIAQILVGIAKPVQDYIIDKIIPQSKLPPMAQQLYRYTIRPILNNPASLLLDLMDIEVSMRFSDLLYKVVLKQNDPSPFTVGQPYQFKNLFYAAGYTALIIAAKKGISTVLEKFGDYCYEGSIKNPDSRFFRYSTFIMNNSLLYSGVLTLFLSPLEVIRCQYPRMLLNSFHSGESLVPSPINPVSLAINMIKLQGFKKLYGGVFPYYIANLLEYISNCLDHIEDEDEDDF